jgi:hypothetical protein
MKHSKLKFGPLTSVVLLSLVILAMQVAGQDASPDLVLINGKIFTSNAEHPYVQALAIRGERIAATGDSLIQTWPVDNNWQINKSNFRIEKYLRLKQ